MKRLTPAWLERSTTARLVTLYLALTVATITPLFFFIYHQTDRVVVTGFQNTVEDRKAILLQQFRDGGVPELSRSIRERIASGAAAHGALLLVDGNGRKIAGNLAAWPPTLPSRIEWAEMRLYREGQRDSELLGISVSNLPSGEHMLVGQVMDDRARLLNALGITLAGALLLSVPIGLLGAFILLRFINRRVNAFGAVAARIAAGDLSRRVETIGSKDPFDRLGMSLNDMLARIEALIEELKLVTDALAHDLRSPLMRMRASIEKVRANSDEGTARAAVEAVANEMEVMLRMLSSTLEISRTEAGIGRENFSQFDLGGLVHDLCELYHPLAEERGVAMGSVRRDVPYSGDRELIGQAVSNLVDNALKYASGGGSIRIGIDETPSSVRLWVADRGGGIAADQREEAVRKYRRLDPARTTDGSGLGLALVRAVARMHGGELILEDNEPGLRAVLMLPRGDASAA